MSFPPKKSSAGRGKGQGTGSAFSYALRLLSYRSRSSAELLEKMALKGFTGQQADEALQKLERLGYINDSALAESLARLARETRGLGRRGAMGYLLKRGISASLADEALAGYDESEGAMRMALKKLRTMERAGPETPGGNHGTAGSPGTLRRSRETLKSRLYGALARRGFSPRTIKQVFLKIEEEGK